MGTGQKEAVLAGGDERVAGLGMFLALDKPLTAFLSTSSFFLIPMLGSAILMLLKFNMPSLSLVSALIVFSWLCASVLASLEFHNFSLTP